MTKLRSRECSNGYTFLAASSILLHCFYGAHLRQSQGLSYGDNGLIYETTGLYGSSKLRKINPKTFDVELSVDIDGQYFGEGSTTYRDANGKELLIVITWRKQTGWIYDAGTFERIREFKYTTTAPSNQGWGITYDSANREFIVSDGSKYLYFWDVETLAEKRKVAVTRFDGREQDQLNELEYMDGLVCCNIWHQDEIICVDPSTGKSVREYDMSSLWPASERGNSENVLNGIALGKDHVLITGKRWDRMFKVVFLDWPSLFVSTKDGEKVGDSSEKSTISCDTAEEDPNAVSYNFLRTRKGSETMRLLLDDLLAPSPEQPKRALKHLEELMAQDAQILDSCHPLAHNLGRTSYQLFGTLEEAFYGLLGTDDVGLVRMCNAAYLHGVIEFHLREARLEDLAIVSQEIEEEVCNKLTNVTFGTWECHHGIGHGIIQRHRMESERDIILKGLQTCKATANAAECENGLWMDHFAVSGNILAMETRMMAGDVVVGELLKSLGEGRQDVDLSRFQLPPLPPTLQICHIGISLSNCFIYAASEYLLAHPGDYIGSLNYCTHPTSGITAKEVGFCVSGAGSQCAKENLEDYSVCEKSCSTLSDADQGVDCFQAALGYFSMNTPGKTPKESGLCDNLTTYKTLCMLAT